MLPPFWEGGLAPFALDLCRRGANNSHGGPMLRGLDFCLHCMDSAGAEFDWDSQNLLHFARQRVSPEEAEQALRNDPMVVQCQDHER